MATKNTTSWWCFATICCFLLMIVSQLRGVEAAAVMSVDLGSEWMKVGIVSPGVPMEIALNRESKRKTPVTLSFRGGVRTFGEDAVTVGIKEPAMAYSYLLDLLGKTIDHPIVKLYRNRFPYYEIIGDPERNTVIFKKSETEQFSVEELIAQILVKAKEFAQEAANQVITEAVVTVPGFFGQAERSALLTAAQLANLKILQLINDYTAVALNYGVFHPSGINETSQYYIFYDMGASHTSSAVVSYQLIKDKHTKETHPVVQILGVGYDRTLGGLEIQLRLRDYLAAEFNAMKKTTTDVTKSPKALAKLFKEAGRLKNVLSANNDHYAQIENLLEDHDFKVQVTREKLEEICSDLWPRVVKPLEKALASSGLSLDIISQVVMFGGGTRVPKVQETIKQYIKQDLAKNINADEAAAIGAAYKAADLATGFKVKKFIVKDSVVFPIQVTFNRSDKIEGAEGKQVKRVLFGLMNTYPQKKVITFNKHTEDFDFYVQYGDLNHLTAEEQSYIGSLNIAHVELKNIKALLETTKNESVDSKGIKAYFSLDESGTFHCTGVEYVHDKQKVEVEEEDEGTLAKLGNTFSKLFSKEKDDNKEDQQETNRSTDETEKMNNENKTQETTSESADDAKGDEQKDAAKKSEKIKIITVKEPIEHTITLQFTPPIAGQSYEDSVKKLDSINQAESLRNRLESSFNALEAHVIDVQQKLQEDEYASCLTEEEKNKILLQCSEISEWLYEDIEDPTPEIYDKKLNDLKMLTNVLMTRHWEHEERPEALKTLGNMIAESQKFFVSAQNLTKEANPEKDVFTQVEIDQLSKVISETVEWKKIETLEQNKLKRYEELRLTVKDITDKMRILDREVKYLINKIKIWKPKVKPEKKDKKKKKVEDAEEVEKTIEEEFQESGSGSENISNKEEQVEAPSTEKPEEEQTDETPIPIEEHTPRSDL